MTPVWTPQALSDLAQVFEHIAADNPRAAAKLRDRALEIGEVVLPAQPLMGRPGRVRDTREFIVRPSYILVYRVRGERLELLAFRHAARLWPERF